MSFLQSAPCSANCMRLPGARDRGGRAPRNSDPSFAGKCGSFAEYRVSAPRIALKIPAVEGKDHHLFKGDEHE